MNIEIASIIFEMCIVPEPATTSGAGLLLDRDTGMEKSTSELIILATTNAGDFVSVAYMFVYATDICINNPLNRTLFELFHRFIF